MVVASAGSVLAACGGADDGALLDVVAPDGPGSAARIELLLANAKSDMIQEVDDQRVQAGDFAQEGVRYYRQRAIAGEVTAIERVDGFRVRIEPNEDLVAEKDLIPFLIAYDAEDHIIGIGSHLDASGQPTKIEIRDDLLRIFEITMTPMTETTGEAGVGTGEALVVSCGTFKSGVAFQPGDIELRLLLPDRSQDDTRTDASERELDMDCDTVIADNGDCDDLRSEFHAGAPETCDGMDHDCDFRRFELVTCSGITSTCGETEGVQLCVDDAGGASSVCQPAPECQCANGSGGLCDNHCLLSFNGELGASAAMCDPQVNPSLVIPGCEGLCTVEVLQRPGDEFRAEIALEGDPNFTVKLHDVPGKIQLKVEHTGANPVTATPSATVGGVTLAILPNNANLPRLIAIGLLLESQARACDPAGNTQMTCTLEP